MSVVDVVFELGVSMTESRLTRSLFLLQCFFLPMICGRWISDNTKAKMFLICCWPENVLLSKGAVVDAKRDAVTGWGTSSKKTPSSKDRVSLPCL